MAGLLAHAPPSRCAHPVLGPYAITRTVAISSHPSSIQLDRSIERVLGLRIVLSGVCRSAGPMFAWTTSQQFSPAEMSPTQTH